MAKEWAVESSEQSTHAKTGKQVPRKSVSSTLLDLRVKAKREPKYRFRSLYREIDLRMLHDSFRLLKPKAAVGIDNVSWYEYENNLDANLRDLLERLKTQRYRAKQIRRKYIPKASGKLRPLGIPSLEDKIVQMSARRLLQAIYEPIFSDNSMGYRPERGAREASRKLRDQLFFSRVHWIVETDIKGFFDHMDHDWLIRMLEERIADSHFIRLIRKWLRAGILEEDGSVLNPITGTPQGGIVSPVLANIYLHYALDLWVEKIVKKRCSGQVVYQRYADDFVVGFEYGYEAKSFFEDLPKRLNKFSLEIAPEKSGILRFSRSDLRHSKRFVYLGFDFYWARTRRGKQTVKRRINKKKFQQALKSLKTWLTGARSTPLKQLAGTLRAKLVGHFNYYGVIGNSQMLSDFFNAARHTIYRVLNNRSQKKSYSWEGFTAMWKTLDIPNPKIIETMQPSTPCLI
jgi:group II intron reverse transcriptase/maturase